MSITGTGAVLALTQVHRWEGPERALVICVELLPSCWQQDKETGSCPKSSRSFGVPLLCSAIGGSSLGTSERDKKSTICKRGKFDFRNALCVQLSCEPWSPALTKETVPHTSLGGSLSAHVRLQVSACISSPRDQRVARDGLSPREQPAVFSDGT